MVEHREANITRLERDVIEGRYGPHALEAFQEREASVRHREHLLERLSSPHLAFAAGQQDIGRAAGHISIMAVANGWLVTMPGAVAPAPISRMVGQQQAVAAGQFDRPQARDTDERGTMVAPLRPVVVMTVDQLGDLVRAWAISDQLQHHERQRR